MVDLAGQTVVAILTRAPGSGGKTRLFEALGCAPDPDLLAALLLDTLSAAELPGTVRVVCVTPPEAIDAVQALVPTGIHILPQTSGDLGQRMRSAFDDLLVRGASAVLLIGSDVPQLPNGVLRAARDVLATRPDAVVLGPARDGGYYLVGATQTPVPLFDIDRWGTKDVLAVTLDRAARAGIEVALLAEGEDIDMPADLRALAESASAQGHRTRDWFKNWERRRSHRPEVS